MVDKVENVVTVRVLSTTECLSEVSDFPTPTDATRDWSVDSEEHGGHLAEPLGSDQLLYRRHVALTRRKRNILFPSGVKLCTQETFDQAVTNHLRYFHLRGTLVFSLWIPICLQVLFLVLSVSDVQKFPFWPMFFPLTPKVFR